MSNILLLSLSLVDLLSGTVIQPVWIACLFSTLKYPYDNFPCGLVIVSGIIGYIVACISLVTVSFISLERYVAIFHPYVHTRRMNGCVLKRTCIILWVVPCPILLGLYFSESHELFFWFNGGFIVVIYIWNIGIYVRISIRVHKVRRQLLNLHRRFANERRELVTQSRGTRVAGAIIVALLVCYLPHVVESLLRIVLFKRFLFEYVEYWTCTMAFLSPCLNPLFYCYYNSEIRRGVGYMLKHAIRKGAPLPCLFKVTRISPQCTQRTHSTMERVLSCASNVLPPTTLVLEPPKEGGINELKVVTDVLRTIVDEICNDNLKQ